MGPPKCQDNACCPDAGSAEKICRTVTRIFCGFLSLAVRRRPIFGDRFSVYSMNRLAKSGSFFQSFSPAGKKTPDKQRRQYEKKMDERNSGPDHGSGSSPPAAATAAVPSNDSTPFGDHTLAAPTVEIPLVEDLTGTDTSAIPGLRTVCSPLAWSALSTRLTTGCRWTIPTARCPFPTSRRLRQRLRDVMTPSVSARPMAGSLRSVSSAWDSVPRCRAVWHHGRQHRRPVHDDRRAHE